MPVRRFFCDANCMSRNTESTSSFSWFVRESIETSTHGRRLGRRESRMLRIDQDQMNSAVSSSTTRAVERSVLLGFFFTRCRWTLFHAVGCLTNKYKKRIPIILIIPSRKMLCRPQRACRHSEYERLNGMRQAADFRGVAVEPEKV